MPPADITKYTLKNMETKVAIEPLTLTILGLLAAAGAGGGYLAYSYYQQAQNVAQNVQQMTERELPVFKQMLYGGLGGTGLGALLGYALSKPEHRTAGALLGGLGGLSLGGILGPSMLKNVK